MIDCVPCSLIFIDKIKKKRIKFKLILFLLKNKNKKPDINDKIKNHKKFDKRAKKKKESKIKWSNWKILYIQIRIKGLNRKQIKFEQQGKRLR